MMSNEESWIVKTYVDELLNFIIFTGCMFDLIDNENFDENNKPWPRNLYNSNNLKDKEKLRLQWKSWFNEVINKRATKDNKLYKMCNFVHEEYNIDNFLELNHIELREYCKISYPHFMEWWYMQAGGHDAMSYYESILNNNIYECIEELECKLNRKSKPFILYIDLVYTGVIDVLDVNNNYIVATSHGYFNLSKSWWISKLNSLL